MDNELERKLIRIALNFIHHALNGIHENDSRYYITSYNFVDCIQINLNDLYDRTVYMVTFTCDGRIFVEQDID